MSSGSNILTIHGAPVPPMGGWDAFSAAATAAVTWLDPGKRLEVPCPIACY